MDKLTEHGCAPGAKDRVCRSRGGESCAFDGAMIVLQPIADAAHIVHGPIACCGNSWEGRGSLSRERGVSLLRMGFTTDMSEMDIVYGSEEKLLHAILQTCRVVKPKAVFVYATCVSGLIGEDIDAVCRQAHEKIGIPVIPVNAPGFVGPKNLGNRIAGEVLLDHVIGTGEPPLLTEHDINLIGEYNIAGDLWLIEPLLAKAGIRVLSRLTGDATFEEITYAHKAKLNVVVCGRALINVAKEMERKYGTPYVEVSFFGRTETTKAVRLIASKLGLEGRVEAVIAEEEERLEGRLKPYGYLKGKRAVLYSGGVKSWSFISALRDLGIETVAVGTKKSTYHDEEKMKEILGERAPLVEDTSPGNLLKLLRQRKADMLIAGGRNQYLGIKEGYPFVDVNQERHTPYAGYDGLVNLAAQIDIGMRFYGKKEENRSNKSYRTDRAYAVINPLKHSQSTGAAIAFQGVHGALPVIHGAQGCTFLGKALLTRHFREPIALAGTKLFAEDVIMGSDGKLIETAKGFIEKSRLDVIGILTSGLSEVKGDDTQSAIKRIRSDYPECRVLCVPTPDYEGGLETGYARAVEEMAGFAGKSGRMERQVNVLAGLHLTPADFTELREIIESFGLKPVILPDLSALDGSRKGVSPLAIGGTTVEDIELMGSSEFTIAVGASMERGAEILTERFGIPCRVFDGIAGLGDSDALMETLSSLSGKPVPPKYERQRRVLIDGMRDAHFFYGNKRIGIALEPDLALQTARWLTEMGAKITTVVLPQPSEAAVRIPAEKVIIGDLASVEGGIDLLIANSHAEDTAKRLGIPLYQMGFPLQKILGANSRVGVGYRGSLFMINEIGNVLMLQGQGVGNHDSR
ncbi:MAG: nitrogenase iron-molybdenum cofactor biosynthesis protein NifE [Nitrospiraceae bacterium]|nr:nitrogenase iron-molybdenum cofactor biosynthesis protein NifE [Nitrospiraceae bacterium]